MIKLKEIIGGTIFDPTEKDKLKESKYAFDRKFGEPLPTFKGVMEKHQELDEGGMGILTSDQADVLQGLVMKHKNKNSAAILRLVIKSGYFKGVNKKEMLGYIEGAKDFAKYMRM